MHGKMGIAIYFFNLARETQDVVYSGFAEKLVEEIYQEIDVSTPLDFENGLAGIGWGIEYLVQNGFIEGDTDEALDEIDNQLYLFKDLFQRTEFSNGLVGLGGYYLKRLQNQSTSNRTETAALKIQMVLYVINELELQIKSIEIANFIHKPQCFKLTWDYTLIISFLLEVYQLDLDSLKVSALLHQLITPLFQKTNLPQLHSHCLFMLLIIAKIKHSNIGVFPDQSLEELRRSIACNIENDQIIKELTPGSAFLLDGSTGIEFIYLRLWQLTGDAEYRDSALQWKTFSLKLEESDQGYAGFKVAEEDEKKAFGLLEGLAGIGLTWCMEKKLNKKA